MTAWAGSRADPAEGPVGSGIEGSQKQPFLEFLSTGGAARSLCSCQRIFCSLFVNRNDISLLPGAGKDALS